MALDSGAAEFREIGLRMKAADKSLLPIVRKQIRASTAPVSTAIRAEALATLPKGGGANEWVASSKISTSVLLGPKTAGVKITAKKKGHDLKDVDAGVLRHPTYGYRGPGGWSETKVQPGFFSRPTRAAQAPVAAACMAAMVETARIAGFK